jgi:hypothetical protein
MKARPQRGCRSVLGSLALLAALPLQPARAADAGQASEPAFVEVAKQSGIHFVHRKAVFDSRLAKIMPWISSLNAGVAIGDFDGDGDMDIYFLTSERGFPNELYRNDGNFTFVEVGEASGVARVNQDIASMDAIFVDVDNDGDQDLFIAGYGGNKLLINDGAGHFTEAPATAGITQKDNAAAVIAFDLDNDGRLDFMVGNYFDSVDLWNIPTTTILPSSFERARNGGPKRFYHNNGNGTFSEIAKRVGLDDTGWTLALGAGDLDGDGDLDVYVANDYGEDVLYRNNGDGTMTNVTRQATGGDFAAGMNVEMGDIDGDGDLDIYVTNVTNEAIRQGNMLWVNEGDLVFVDKAKETGTWDGGWGWGAKFLDFDNDGDLDIYTVNGYVSAGPIDLFRSSKGLYRQLTAEDTSDLRQWPDMRGYSMSGFEHKRLFRNDGGKFREVAKENGVDSILDGRGVAIADLDGDGNEDMVVTNSGGPPLVYRNRGVGHRSWLEVELVGTTSNRDAIGARIEVVSGGKLQVREVDGGNGFSGKSSRIMHIGLGDREHVEELRIRWPSGKKDVFRDLSARKRLVIME